MSDTDSDPDVSKLAREVIDELDSGRYGDKFVFSRRQVIALAGAGLSVGALTTLGVDEATAQEAVGRVGTEDEPIDVEAATVNAGSVSTEDLQTAPTGVVVTKGQTSQDIANNTTATVAWNTESETRGNVSGLLDDANDEVVVPSNYSYARINVAIRYTEAISNAFDRFDISINGSSNWTGSVQVLGSNATAQSGFLDTGWASVSENDSISVNLRQASGSKQTIQASATTNMEVWLI